MLNSLFLASAVVAQLPAAVSPSNVTISTVRDGNSFQILLNPQDYNITTALTKLYGSNRVNCDKIQCSVIGNFTLKKTYVFSYEPSYGLVVKSSATENGNVTTYKTAIFTWGLNGQSGYGQETSTFTDSKSLAKLTDEMATNTIQCSNSTFEIFPRPPPFPPRGPINIQKKKALALSCYKPANFMGICSYNSSGDVQYCAVSADNTKTTRNVDDGSL